MLTDILMPAARRFARAKVFYTINVIGMSLALAVALMALNIAHWELSYDARWTSADRLHTTYRDSGYSVDPNLSGPMAGYIIDNIPEISASVLMRSEIQDLTIGRSTFSASVIQAQPSVADVFGLEQVSGNLTEALEDPSSLAISEAMARTLFQDLDPVGQSVMLAERSYKIAALYKDTPRNSSLRFDVLASLSDEAIDYADWRARKNQLYYLLTEGADLTRVQNRFSSLSKEISDAYDRVRGKEPKPDKLHFGQFQSHSLNNVYLQGIGLDGKNTKPIERVTYISLVALIIVTLAILNTAGLLTAKAARERADTAIRKVMGAPSTHIFARTVTEALLLTLISGLIAAALAEVTSPLLATMLGTDAPAPLGNWTIIAAIAALALGAGLLSGAYPGLVLARTLPARLMSTNARSSWKQTPQRVQKSLVGIQFFLAAVVFVCTAAMQIQIIYMAKKDLGFSVQNVAYVHDAPPVFKNMVDNMDIASATAWSQSTVTQSPTSYTFYVMPKRRMEVVTVQEIGANFFDTMQIELLAGQNLTPLRREENKDGLQLVSNGSEPKADNSWVRKVILNRAAADLYEFASPEEALGKTLRLFFREKSEIVGVVPNVKHESVIEEVNPTIYFIKHDERPMPLIVKYEGSDKAITNSLKALWQDRYPDQPFAISFAEDLIYASLHREQTMSLILLTCSLIALLIACIGIYGLMHFAVTKHRLEVAMRKTMGATTRQIFMLMSWRNIRLALGGLAVAAPVSCWVICNYLERYPFRIEVIDVWGICLVASFLLLIPGLVTVALQTRQAARLVPAKILRTL